MSDPLETYLAYQQRSASARSEPSPTASAFGGADAAAHAAIDARVAELRPRLEGLARALHEQPELGFEEHRSAARIAELLTAEGADARPGAFGLDTALHATVGEGGPHLAIIAEYDALPGIGHACGHNLIAGIAVGAFLAASPHVERLGGRLSLIGTPAEENGGGKELILRAGGFDDVDAAAMVHPTGGDRPSPVGGQRTTGVRRVAVTYHGRAAHAAGAPWLGLNALDAVVTAYQGVAQLRQHILPIDRVHGIITDGGQAPNIVPERAAALFYVRSGELDALRALTDRVVAVLEGAALSTGTRAQIEVDPVPPYLPLEPNESLTRHWARALQRRGRIVPDSPAGPQQAGPSTDMGNVSRFVPSIHPSLGIGSPPSVQPHTEAFADWTVRDGGLAALADGAAALASAAIDYLADGALRAAVDEEFAALGGRYRWEG